MEATSVSGTRNKFTQQTAWSAGEFQWRFAQVDGGDLNEWNANKFLSSSLRPSSQSR